MEEQSQKLEKNEKEEEEERQKYLVDEPTFASLCKKSPAAMIGKCLDQNPDLLNCLGGQPLRQAALGRNVAGLGALLDRSGVLVNLKDKNGHTALHLGTANDQPEIVRKLLHHEDVDPNPVSRIGLTPIMMATKKGKIQALEALLEDDRINLDEVDEEGNLLEDLIGTGLANKPGEHKLSAGIKLFEDTRKWRSIRDGTLDRKKTVVFVINCKYSTNSGLANLNGPADDLKIAEKVFKARGYTTHVIKDAKDVEGELIQLIDENESEFKELDVLQFVYSGHGIHQTTVEKGDDFGEDDAGEYFHQEGHLGDCVVNTNGDLCSELLLSFLLSTAVNEAAHIGIFMDMCRTENKIGVRLRKRSSLLKLQPAIYKRTFRKLELTGALSTSIPLS